MLKDIGEFILVLFNCTRGIVWNGYRVMFSGSIAVMHANEVVLYIDFL